MKKRGIKEAMETPSPVTITLRRCLFAFLLLAFLNLLYRSLTVGQSPSVEWSLVDDKGLPKVDEDSPSVPHIDDCAETASYPLHVTEYKQRRNISDFMEEVLTKADPVMSAVCRFRHELPYSKHFPHTLQQLLRCWSWWLYQQRHMGNNLKLILECDTNLFPPRNPFLSGFFQLLNESARVQFVSNATSHNNQPFNVAQARLNDGGLYDFAMASRDDAVALRKAAIQTFDLTNPTHCPQRPRILLLNRKQKRKILNSRSLQQALESIGSVKRVYFEGRSFPEQLSYILQTDILVSSHGAQLTSLPFLPPCASVLELFPTGYYEPPFFGTLAAASGVTHGYLYLGVNRTHEVAMGSQNIAARIQTRRANLCPPIQNVQEAVQHMVDAWKQCCRRQYKGP